MRFSMLSLMIFGAVAALFCAANVKYREGFIVLNFRGPMQTEFRQGFPFTCRTFLVTGQSPDSPQEEASEYRSFRTGALVANILVAAVTSVSLPILTPILLLFARRLILHRLEMRELDKLLQQAD